MNSYSPVFISAFSIGSVTCRETCSAVAPGQSVRTTIALKVNGGSSDWPRCLYDHAPISAKASIANSTSGRLDNAHSERLKRRTGLLLGLGGSGRRGRLQHRAVLAVHGDHRLAGTQQVSAGSDHPVTRIHAGEHRHRFAE